MAFDPQAGDLLFQQRGEESIDSVIGETFLGYGGRVINHVAIALNSQSVIEAIPPGVCITSLQDFLATAAAAWVFRLKEPAPELIAAAVAQAKTLVGLPYNSDFGDRKDSYYCSELVVDCFKAANSGVLVFPETPMSFIDPKTGEFFDYWVDYYAQRHQAIPQGKPGSHPALLSHSDRIKLVHQYNCSIQ